MLSDLGDHRLKWGWAMRKRWLFLIGGAACIAGALLAPLGYEMIRALPPIETTTHPGVEIVPQTGHVTPTDVLTGMISSVGFSPDGRFALSGGLDHTVKIWEVATGRELRSFEGHSSQVRAAVFSPDGRFVVSRDVDSNGKLVMWEAATGKELRRFRGYWDWTSGGSVSSLAFSPDGRSIFSSSRNTIKMWDVATGKEKRSFSGHSGDVTSLAISRDGDFALSGSQDETLKLWDVATGRELRTFGGHRERVVSVAFSPDGRLALSGGNGTMRLWEVGTGRELRSFAAGSGGLPVSAVAFSPDGRLALSGSTGTLKLWDVATGEEVDRFTEQTSVFRAMGLSRATFSPDGKFILSGWGDNTMKLLDVATRRETRSFTRRTSPIDAAAFSSDRRFALFGSGNELRLWDITVGRELRSFGILPGAVLAIDLSSDGRLAISSSDDKGPGKVWAATQVQLWDVTSGRELRRLSGHSAGVTDVALSPDGRFALTSSWDKTVKLWDVATARELRNFTGHNLSLHAVAFSPDGRLALSGGEDTEVKLWDLATGREIRSFSGHRRAVISLAFSPDGRFALSGSRDHTLRLWDLATGKQLRSFSIRPNQGVVSVAFSADGRFALSGSEPNLLQSWDVTTGKEMQNFTGHQSRIASVAFSGDGRFVLSASLDGTMRLWDAQSGRQFAQMLAAPDGEWLTITPEGFFSSSHRDTDMLTIVRGVEPTTIGQVQQSLFNPDLVREALAGDPDGEVTRAADVIRLETVLDAGPAPSSAITSHKPGSRSDVSLAAVTARLTDRGKGIGRIEWRVNGVTAGVEGVSGAGPSHDIKRTLALDPGENNIEVIAYERRNLLASPPAQTTITFKGPADPVKPKLHVLAIGVNAYIDKGSANFGQFPPLNLAVSDAKAFAAKMQQAGAKQYGEVSVTLALDSDAARSRLDQIVEQVAAKTSPRDTFVLFAAGHGISKDDRFYLIPQDYEGGADPQALASRAIGQERLQHWLANLIKARKALILLDTCESGALVSGYTRSRTDTTASEAAIGRLHEAIGRPVLTAAASGKPAFEGYKGHGVFTYSLMDALHNGDVGRNGLIELSELVAYVQDAVPKFSAELNSRGNDKSTAVVVSRGFHANKQSAHFGSTGEDFALVRRLQ